ncbi:MAG: MotA/TolQ/ExbB proton channel family protein [Bacteroidia bacterium]|nr:MotA/TolQ/ExbB proton channel family protein [Bacteroidia bacterium]
MLNSVLIQMVVSGTNTATQVVDSAATVAAQVPATAVTLPPPAQEATLSVFDLVMKGGFIMIPMAILLLLTIFYFFERLMVISKLSKMDKNFMNNIKDYIHNGNIDAAKALCKNTTAPAARMVEKGLSRLGKPIKEIEEAMESVGKLEINRMEKNLNVLSLIGRIAPIFGFIGTIAGVIKIFYDISLTDNISIGVISTGLYQKMITSATGLVIGLLAFIFYYILNTMLDRTINKMETASVEFMDILHGPGK